jgi:hypothetical protein
MEEVPDVNSEPWVQEFKDKLAEFDTDHDGVLDEGELREFIVKGIELDADSADKNMDFFMKSGPESDPSYLATGGGMTLEGLLQFYANASIGRAGTVRKNLTTLQLAHTVPQRHYEKTAGGMDR